MTHDMETGPVVAERFSVKWFKARVLEVTVALALTYTVVGLFETMDDARKGMTPASAWFQVNEVFVPDHAPGDNPEMIYDRSVLEFFKGLWIVEVQEIKPGGLFQHVCSGSGTNNYSTSEVIVDDIVDWEWFIGRECRIPPGTYRLRVSYTLKRVGWPEKETLVTSNVFRVRSVHQ